MDDCLIWWHWVQKVWSELNVNLVQYKILSSLHFNQIQRYCSFLLSNPNESFQTIYQRMLVLCSVPCCWGHWKTLNYWCRRIDLPDFFLGPTGTKGTMAEWRELREVLVNLRAGEGGSVYLMDESFWSGGGHRLALLVMILTSYNSNSILTLLTDSKNLTHTFYFWTVF